jgi:hypothetical protein
MFFHVGKMQEHLSDSHCVGAINMAAVSTAQMDNWKYGHSVQSSVAQKICTVAKSSLSLSYQLRCLIEKLIHIEACHPVEKKKEKKSHKIKHTPLQAASLRVLVAVSALANSLTELLDEIATYQYL